MKPDLLCLCTNLIRFCLVTASLISAVGVRADERPSVLSERAENFALAESRTIAPVDVGFGTFQSNATGDGLSNLGLDERKGAALSATVYFPGPMEWAFKAAFAESKNSNQVDEESVIRTQLNTKTIYTGPALNAVLFTNGDKFLSGSLGGGGLWRDFHATLSDDFVTENDKGWSLGAYAEGALHFHAFTKLVFGLRLWGERCQMNLPQVADRKVTDQTYSTAWEVAFAL